MGNNSSIFWKITIIISFCATLAIGTFSFFEISEMQSEIQDQNVQILDLSKRPITLETGIIEHLRVNRLSLLDENGKYFASLLVQNGRPVQVFSDNNGKNRLAFGLTSAGKPTFELLDANSRPTVQIQEVDTSTNGTIGRITSQNPQSKNLIALTAGFDGSALMIQNGNSAMPSVMMGTRSDGTAVVAVSDGNSPRVAFGAGPDKSSMMTVLSTSGEPDMLIVNTNDRRYWFYSKSSPAQRLWNALSAMSTLKSVFDVFRGR